jgi:YidC/Oxa1 family membrane protein insertase
MNQKMSELYKKEGASPMSGCLPMLLSYPLLIIMWNAMRAFANEQVVRQVVEILQHPETMPVLDSWLWIKNLWMPDSPFSSALVDLNSLRQIPTEVWTKLVDAETLQQLAALHPGLSALTTESFAKSELTATIQLIYSTLEQTAVYQQAAGGLPGWTNISVLITTVSIMKEYNGLLILPILSAASQFAMTAILGNNQPTPAATDAQQQTQQSTANFMKWFFPIFSLWICLSYNGAFALYWVTSNLIMMVSTFGINKYLDSKEKKQTVNGEASIK